MSCLCCQELILNTSVSVYACGHILCNTCTRDVQDPLKCMECNKIAPILQPNEIMLDSNLQKFISLQSLGATYLERVCEEYKQITTIKVAAPDWSLTTIVEFGKFARAMIKSYATDQDTLADMLIALQSAINNYKTSLSVDCLRATFVDNFEKIYQHWDRAISHYKPVCSIKDFDNIYLFCITKPPMGARYIIFISKPSDNLLTYYIKTFPCCVHKSWLVSMLHLHEDEDLIARRIRASLADKLSDASDAQLYWTNEVSTIIFFLDGYQIPVREYELPD